MHKVKVYVIFNGQRDGSMSTTNEIEESIWKIVSKRQKAVDLIVSETGLIPDEDGCVKFNQEEHPHNGHEDTDYEYYRIEEHELEQD